jgi:hypothetical protein
MASFRFRSFRPVYSIIITIYPDRATVVAWIQPYSMTFPFFHYNAKQEAPFTIVVEQREKTRDEHWQPAAFIKITPSLRTSGFLFALSPEELQSFLMLLTFISADGRIAPEISQLAIALNASRMLARNRMERLCRTKWLGQSIVTRHEAESGWLSYSPAPGVLPMQHDEPAQSIQPIYRTAPREAIIEHSRRMYARPRAEVERQIEAQYADRVKPPSRISTNVNERAMTYLSPQDEATLQLRQALIGVGIYPEQADELLVEYDHLRIKRQLAWLPYRGARQPAGLLIAAIRDDYEAPMALHQQSGASENASGSTPVSSTDAQQ